MTALLLSSNSFVDFILYIVFVTAFFIAIARIIGKAGFHQAWVLLPLSCYVLFWVIFGWTFYELRYNLIGFIYSPGTVKILNFLAKALFVDMFINVVAFFVFAFVRWPIQGSSSSTPLPASAIRTPAGPADMTSRIAAIQANIPGTAAPDANVPTTPPTSDQPSASAPPVESPFANDGGVVSNEDFWAKRMKKPETE